MTTTNSSTPASRRTLFGTDGVRGTANQYPMTCEVALALGRAVAHMSKSGSHRHRIVIGKDTRLSGYMIEMAFASGVCSMGVDALLLGPMPTPAVAHLTQDMRADAGVMISASHNPYEDNGIKIFGRDGFKLDDARELQLEQWARGTAIEHIRPVKDEVGKAFRIDDARGRYIAQLKRVMPPEMDLSGMRIVVDCAHGAAYKVAPTVLEELGAEVFAVGVSPNGRNINDGVGAMYPRKLGEAVRAHGADIGLALDGDADRLIVVDERGDQVDGDAVIGLAARQLHRAGDLKNDGIATTVMSNLALDKFLKKEGVSVTRTPVGDRYVVEAMRRDSLILGGEQSGHLVFLDHATTGDGMVAALCLLTLLRREEANVSEMTRLYEPYPQQLINVQVREKPPIEELESVMARIQSAEQTLGDDGRVMVRYSGTESKARVLVEGPERKLVDELAGDIAALLRDTIGAA